MNARILFARLFLCLCSVVLAGAAPPVVSNIRAAQRAGTHLVDIYYNVADADGDNLTVYVAVSDNGGASYNVPVFTLTGAVGPGVAPGNDRHVVWNAGTDWAGHFSSQCKVKITADDGTAPPAPAGMAYIPAGPFQMGDPFFEGSIPAEIPVHTVHLSAFFMDKNLISREQWLDVYSWALGQGYSFSNAGQFRDAKHPVHSINWYDAVRWCNARSEKEGLTPCYFDDIAMTSVSRRGQPGPIIVNWDAKGYRLPTEAEWEKAARGGLKGKRFPWGDTVSHAQANYFSAGGYAYEVSPIQGIFHPIYGIGSQPFTSPVSSFAANGYGLFDMAGNSKEWTWDIYSDIWYGQPGASADDPRGPSSVGDRVVRGSYWGDDARGLRCAVRIGGTPTSANIVVGFRCVRGL